MMRTREVEEEEEEEEEEGKEAEEETKVWGRGEREMVGPEEVYVGRTCGAATIAERLSANGCQRVAAM